MRQILKSLMNSKGHTGHSLYELSGVPSATTYRFLTGSHGDPRSGTVRRWARVYGISEAQMRGIEPIEHISIEKVDETSMTLESVLTREELKAIEGMRGLDKDLRRARLKIGTALCTIAAKPERRSKTEEIAPDSERRNGERRSNPHKRTRLRQHSHIGGLPVEKKA